MKRQVSEEQKLKVKMKALRQAQYDNKGFTKKEKNLGHYY
jgi:hypothetical protein